MKHTDLAPDGLPFNIVTLKNHQGMTVTFCDWGATWQSCQIPVHKKSREVLLGCASPTQYLQQDAYLGATVGRYANRIAGANIDYQGINYALSANQGAHQLHGGLQGFDKRRWSIVQQSDNAVIFSLHSVDGDQGYPGNLSVTASYTLDENNKLIIVFSAKTDKATPVNLTNHAYFNLDGDATHQCPNVDIREHVLYVNADYYLPIEKNGIPLGSLEPVEIGDMDLRSGRKIADDLLTSPVRQLVDGYDHAYLLNLNQDVVAKLISSDGKVTLNVYTTKPALQVYTGNFLAGTSNRIGGCYQQYAGIALETQFLPDSPHYPQWPQASCWLLPSDVYQHQTVYELLVSDN